MDYESLIQEVVSRVMSKLAELGKDSQGCGAEADQCCTFCEAPAAVKEKKITKRVLTEKDVIAARNEGATRIVAGENTIITDLAKDYAAAHRVEMVRK